MSLLETVVSEKKQDYQEKLDVFFAPKEEISRNIHYNNIDSVFSSFASKKLDPTKNLASRFNAWKNLLKELIIYFKAVINIEEVKANEFKKLGSILNAFSFDNNVFYDGGVHEVKKVFCNCNQRYSKHLSSTPSDINANVLIKLEKTRAMLTESVKNVIKMSPQFRSNLSKEVDTAKKLMENYKESLLIWESNPEKITPKTDPYIVKLYLERQIARALLEENTLQQAYLNIENYCRSIEKYVIDIVREIFNYYKDIIQNEISVISDFSEEIGVADSSISLDKGWNIFLKNDPVFKLLIED